MVYETKRGSEQFAVAMPLSEDELRRWGIPSFVRIEVPLDDPIWYRTIADRLRVLATELDLLSRTGDRPAHHVAWEAQHRVKDANQAMKKTLRQQT